MNDRMTVASKHAWRHDTLPPIGRIVEIWCSWTIIEAQFDGQMWRSPGGTPVAVDAWWREKVQG